MSDHKLSDPTEARKKAMDYLARREHARVELLDKLVRAGFDAEVANEAVAGLIDDGLQSDERFAEAFVRSRIGQGKGPVRISSDLRHRGVSGPTAERALEDANEDWRALARDVRLKKFGPDTPSDFRERARQMRFLQSRGFDSEQIQAAVSPDYD